MSAEASARKPCSVNRPRSGLRRLDIQLPLSIAAHRFVPARVAHGAKPCGGPVVGLITGDLSRCPVVKLGTPPPAHLARRVLRSAVLDDWRVLRARHSVLIHPLAGL